MIIGYSAILKALISYSQKKIPTVLRRWGIRYQIYLQTIFCEVIHVPQLRDLFSIVSNLSLLGIMWTLIGSSNTATTLILYKLSLSVCFFHRGICVNSPTTFKYQITYHFMQFRIVTPTCTTEQQTKTFVH